MVNARKVIFNGVCVEVKWRLFLVNYLCHSSRGGLFFLTAKRNKNSSLKSFDQMDSAKNIFLQGQNF
ncbi:hypothetical protein SAMN05660206_11136 [Sphingobacterium wenxiniae]|uniref:Uncharacterized protein n=1 Tax=Sphingobacterium wenxiniae TaxID=683125 RepID=A0A1I6V356_9SPHI|nr:hypothetical protein SAMN05660206_11136 [Sphingobacterium wenxiniae]